MQSIIFKEIAQSLNVGIEQLNSEFKYQSCEKWDSLSHIKLICHLEEFFQIQFTAEEITKLTTLDNLVQEIQIKKGLKCHETFQQKETNQEKQIFRGLTNITFDKTKVSKIDANQGQLYYQGYNINELIKFCTYEEVAFILIFGRIPSKYESKCWTEDLNAKQFLSNDEIQTIQKFSHLHPIDLLRVIYASYPFEQINGKITRSKLIQSSISLIAKTPTIIAFHHRIRTGMPPIAPQFGKGIAENFLWMLHGTNPSIKEVDCLNQDLILHAEHGSNASCFSARIAVGAKSNFTSAIITAISVFNGRAHGGAIEDVLTMLSEFSKLNKEEIHLEIEKRIQNNSSIPGFGHRVYKIQDPRAEYLLNILQTLTVDKGIQAENDLELARNIRSYMTKYRQKGLEINVDFYAGLSYRLLEIPDDLAMSIFFMARTAGLAAHILEQSENNILIRPLLEYSGDLKIFDSNETSMKMNQDIIP